MLQTVNAIVTGAVHIDARGGLDRISDAHYVSARVVSVSEINDAGSRNFLSHQSLVQRNGRRNAVGEPVAGYDTARVVHEIGSESANLRGATEPVGRVVHDQPTWICDGCERVELTICAGNLVDPRA